MNKDSEHKKHKHIDNSEKQSELKIKKSSLYYVGALVFGIILLWYLFNAAGAYLSDGVSSDASVEIDLYVMSQCPYGVQAEDALDPVMASIGDNVIVDINFIARPSADGFQSLHGQPEVDGNIIQLCAKQYYPDKYFNFIICQNRDYSDLTANVESCAEENGLDSEVIMECFEGEEGKELMTVSITESNKVNAQGSPTIYINGEQYSGARDSTSLQRVLCSYLDGVSGCDNMPACSSDADCTAEADKVGTCLNPGTGDAACYYENDAEVNLIVLNDKTCATCDTTQILAASQQYFKNLNVEYIDVSDDEGEELVEELGLLYAPAFLFDSGVESSYVWSANTQFRSVFEKSGEYYKLTEQATGASHYIDEDAREEYLESIGITLGDNKPQIDFYVMTYCPYGNTAEEAIEPVYQTLGDNADFNPHYVIYSNYNGGGFDYCLDAENKFCSMHGVQELNQGVRELCVDKYYGIGKWFEFALAMNDACNYKNADTCWEAVAEDIEGIDVDVVKTCEADEALDMLAEELELNTVLGVSGSPTVFIDGEKYAGDRSADGYLSSLCAAYDDAPSECGTDLGGVETAAVPAGSCG